MSEQFDRFNLTHETKEFYSNPDNLKSLLIDSETYKRLFEEQQKRIDKFVEKINSLTYPKYPTHKTYQNYYKFDIIKPNTRFNKNYYSLIGKKDKNRIYDEIYFIKDFF